MSAIIKIDTARPGLQSLARKTSGAALHKVIARSALQAARDRFAQVAMWMRNRFGKPAQFWKRMSRASRSEATASAAVLLVPREVAQRFFGGTIRPKGGKKFLTIPVTREAYRRKASTFPDLVLIMTRGSKARRSGILVRAKKNGQMEVLYWLVRGVTQKADPRVMPSKAEFQAHIAKDVDSYLTHRPGGGSATPAPAPLV